MLLLSALALTAYCILGYLIFRTACCRGKDTDWLDEGEVRKTAFAPYADVIPQAEKWLQGHHAQDVWVKSYDSLNLHGCWVPAKNAIGTMILFHGYRSTYFIDFSAIYRLYHNRGYHLLLVSQRCHGKSEGKYITFGVKESRDVATWVDWHNKTAGPIPTFICGMSMGSSTVMYAAANPLPGNVVGITADCGFTSAYDILCHVVGKKAGFLAAKGIMPMVNFWAKHLAGFTLTESSTLQALKDATLPILMIHGRADDYVPCEMSLRSFASCASEKELVLVDNAGHGTSFLVDREKVEASLIRFFIRNNPNETGESLCITQP